MKRIVALFLLSFAPVLLAAAKPNIIFIFADDWGYGDLSLHGSPFCKTPHLDRMAREGIRFENFTVNHPVCSPSRSAVMTGQFPARHSIHRHFATVQHHVKCDMPDWLNPKAPMLPRMLKRAGYVTGHFGKWHLTNRDINDAPLPPKYGYDEYGAFNLLGRQIETAETCPKAIDFIRRNKDKPFFINLWIHETHTPHYPLKKYLAQFKHLNEQQRVYAAIVAEADAAIGQVFETLKELKLDEKTLVIFSSDNGPENTGPATRKQHQDNSTGPGLGTYFSVGTTGGLKGRKRSLMAGGIRVPFIARWPGQIPAGKVNKTSVLTAVDLLPTFLEIAGAKTPAHYVGDGESILAALKGQSWQRTKPIFWEWKGNHRAPFLWPDLGIRDGQWKLLLNAEQEKAELYNISEDWAGKNDVSKKHPEIVKQLTAQLIRWKKTLPTASPDHCISKTRKNK